MNVTETAQDELADTIATELVSWATREQDEPSRHLDAAERYLKGNQGMQLDSRGIPIARTADETSAPECPPSPCELCTGNASDGSTSWEWCQKMHTCAATIDWEKIYGR